MTSPTSEKVQGTTKPHKESLPEEVRSQLRPRVGTSQKGRACQTPRAAAVRRARSERAGISVAEKFSAIGPRGWARQRLAVRKLVQGALESATPRQCRGGFSDTGRDPRSHWAAGVSKRGQDPAGQERGGMRRPGAPDRSPPGCSGAPVMRPPSRCDSWPAQMPGQEPAQTRVAHSHRRPA